MLHVARSHDGEPRIYLRHPALSAEAWIERSRSVTSYPGADWVLWYRYTQRQQACAHKSQLRLEIESVLRAWLLHTYRRRLYAMSFGDLCALAQASRRRARVR